MNKYFLEVDPENGMLKGHDGCHVDDPKEYLWFAVLKGCGCGSSNYFIELAWNVIDYFSQGFDERKSGYIYDEKHMENELMAQWLDSAGLLEHGTSVGGSWLSDEGKELHEAINSQLTTPPEKSKDNE